MKPVVDGNIVARDRQEAGEPRLGREQIVERRIQHVARLVVADREQVAPLVVQEREVHLSGDVLRTVGDHLQP